MLMDRTFLQNKFNGQIDIPASKSLTIRAILIALFAGSVSKIHNPLISEDTKVAIDLCKKFGAVVVKLDNTLTVDSTTLNKNACFEFDCKNSGTTLFFATAMCSAFNNKITFTGDESLTKRVPTQLLNSLKNLGAQVSDCNQMPYTISGPMVGGSTTIDCPTSQYLSALLLSCPMLSHPSHIVVSELNEKPYVIMTESFLEMQQIKYISNSRKTDFQIEPNQKYKGFEITIGGDYSSASFFFAGAAITASKITVKGLLQNDVQGDKKMLDFLQTMGCSVIQDKDSITLIGADELKGGVFDLNECPDLVLPLTVVSCFAKTAVNLVNVKGARIKECDRLSAMANNLNLIGADITEQEDGLLIHPVQSFTGGRVSGFSDHRVVMAMAIAGLRCKNKLTVIDSECVDVSFPSFFEFYDKLIKQESTV